MEKIKRMNCKKLLSGFFKHKITIFIFLISISSLETFSIYESPKIEFEIFYNSNDFENNSKCDSCIFFGIENSKFFEIMYSVKKSMNETNENPNGGSNHTHHDVCNSEFKIIAEYFTENNIRFGFEILPDEPDEYEIKYWIEDFFGNVMRNPFVTRNTNMKQFTPSLDYFFHVYKIKSELVIEGCNSTIHGERYLTFLNRDFELEVDDDDDESIGDSPYVLIDHVYLENHLRHGSSFDVRVKFFNPGNRQKLSIYVVDATGKLISNQIEFDVFRNSYATITQNLILGDECFGDSLVEIIIEGFGAQNTRGVFLSCPNPIDLNEDPENLISEKEEELTFSLFNDESENDTLIEGSVLNEIFLGNSSNIFDFPVIYLSKSLRGISILPKVMLVSLVSVLVLVARYKL